MNKLSQEGILEELDYSPFGMGMVGRSWEAGSGYRYGFNGKENEDEIAGNNNAIDFGARLYDSRLGRWFSCDGKLGCGMCPSCIAKGIKPPKGFKEALELLMGLEGVEVHFMDISSLKPKMH